MTRKRKKMEARLLFIQFSQIALSTLVVFFFMALITETVLCIFRIKNARLRAVLRAIPILKLPLEVLFVREGLLLDLNVFSCTSILKQWIAPFFIAEDQLLSAQLTLCQYIALQIPPTLTLLCASVLTLFLGIAIFKTVQLLYAFYVLKKICGMAEVCEREITNIKLKRKIKAKKVQILMTSAVSIPCAVHSNAIVFPKSAAIQELSQEEFETIVAHELEHLCWYDPLIKFVSILISIIFFWVPTSLWLKNLEYEQEHASDLSIQRYGLSEISLATALVKTMKSLRINQRDKLFTLPLCGFIRGPGSTIKRFHKILKGQNNEILSTFQYCGVVIIALTAVIIGFKMC